MERGLVITTDDPSIVDWDLPMGAPGEDYSITFKAEGGEAPYSWCLWEFTDEDPFDYCGEACGNDEELGCLFEDVTPHDPKEKTDPDCKCDPGTGDRACPCECGIPSNWDLDIDGNMATLSGTYPEQDVASCYEFVLGVMDDSTSPYTGQHQKYLRRFRIRTGVVLPDPQVSGSYDTYVTEDDAAEPVCGEDILLVTPDSMARERVAFLRFARPDEINQDTYRATGGELILHAAHDLLDATLYYVDDEAEMAPDCRIQYGSFPNCAENDKPDWEDDWEEIRDNGHLVPIARICAIEEDKHVRFDISEYLSQRFLDCHGPGQTEYYQFVLTSNDLNTDRGFHGSVSNGDAPRLAFVYTDFTASAVEDGEGCGKCKDCRDNDCDGEVDCYDTEDCYDCNACD